jgi:hypothetical protein
MKAGIDISTIVYVLIAVITIIAGAFKKKGEQDDENKPHTKSLEEILGGETVPPKTTPERGEYQQKRKQTTHEKDKNYERIKNQYKTKSSYQTIDKKYEPVISDNSHVDATTHKSNGNESHSDTGEERFDLREAVIYSEILTRKY